MAKPETPFRVARVSGKTIAEHIRDARDCIDRVEPLLPGRKLTFRRETLLMLCESIIWLAQCAVGNHESGGVIFGIAQGDTITDDQLDVELWREAVEEPNAAGDIHVCKRCRSLFWEETGYEDEPTDP